MCPPSGHPVSTSLILLLLSLALTANKGLQFSKPIFLPSIPLDILVFLICYFWPLSFLIIVFTISPIEGPFKCYATLLFWKVETHPLPRNANNLELYTFATLFSWNVAPPFHPTALCNTWMTPNIPQLVVFKKSISHAWTHFYRPTHCTTHRLGHILQGNTMRDTPTHLDGLNRRQILLTLDERRTERRHPTAVAPHDGWRGWRLGDARLTERRRNGRARQLRERVRWLVWQREGHTLCHLLRFLCI